jgi:hypothetical protein
VVIHSSSGTWEAIGAGSGTTIPHTLESIREACNLPPALVVPPEAVRSVYTIGPEGAGSAN